MVRAITPSDEKLVSKGIDSVRSRVTNLKPYLNGLTQEQLIKHFENTLTNQTYELTSDDIEKINKLAEKYTTKEWIYKKQPPYTKILKKRITGGLFEIKLDLEEGMIKQLAIQGDFFDKKSLAPFEKKFENQPYDKRTIEQILLEDPIEDYILDVKSDEFKLLLEQGVLGE
jgi:lipoate-protein ligase A